MAELRTVSFSQLVEVDDVAMKEVKDAATLQGFFYLDLRGSESCRILTDVDDFIENARKFYDMPLEEKLEYDIDKLGMHKIDGYKPEGRNAGVEKGKQDGFEAYLISRDGICNSLEDKIQITLPAPFDEQRSLIQRLMYDLHRVGTSILRALSLVLGLCFERSLESSHRHNCLSTSALGVLKYPQLWAESPRLGHGAHTDVGSLTLLFCSEAGLQILEADTDRWKYVQPKEGHAIVNIGDSLRFLSGQRLRSCLHRVVPPADERLADRASCAYFLRPELDTVLTDDTGQSWRSVDWHDKKYTRFRAPIEKQQQDSVLTGKAGFVGSWCSGSEEAMET